MTALVDRNWFHRSKDETPPTKNELSSWLDELIKWSLKSENGSHRLHKIFKLHDFSSGIGLS